MINRLLPYVVAVFFVGPVTHTHASESEGSGFFGVSDGREQPSAKSPNAPFYENKERGWFWYEDPLTEEPNDVEQPIKEPPPPAPEKKEDPKFTKPLEPKPLSSEWFRKNMEKYRDKAIDDPTAENVSTYMYLQRVMLDKAEKFADASQKLMMKDAVLDENARRPIATFGAFAKDDMSNRGIQQAAKKLAEQAGIWFFYYSTCEFCVKEAGVLKGLMNAFGFKVLPIALDGLPLPGGSFPEFMSDHGQGKKLSVETTPALFLVKPDDSGGAIQIGQGLLSGEEIVRRAIALAHENGWLNNDEYDQTLAVTPIQVDNETIKSIDEDTMDKPGELVKIIRDNLRKKM
ncbi:MAG: hypothetical protein FJ190_04720 [Gammaproteobacteria bacterium]|nr:hypothetical protein [Gammaproteobacteria bacterium]